MPSNILLVDDEPALLSLMGTYLSKLGHTVEKCSRAKAALALVNAAPKQFQVVVADITLPDMPGPEMALEMLKVSPGLGILLCSGYPFELASLPKPVQGRFSVLQKPFLPKMLAGAVDELAARHR
jgi:DNA-binding NtrC family response regulator